MSKRPDSPPAEEQDPPYQPGERLRAPFPWFGGKSKVADLVWGYFGDTANYVEPFFGSGAVLLTRPTAPRIETINDKDCFIANFWRAVQAAPEEVAFWADQPVNEADLHARHLWLVCQEGFRQRMLTDPDYYDAKIAGWWVWGISCWIGSGWCYRPDWSGRINAAICPRGIHQGLAAITRKRRPQLGSQNGVHVDKKRPSLTNKGGVHGRSLIEPSGRQTPKGNGVWKKRPELKRGGRGVNGLPRQVPDISGNRGTGGRTLHSSALGQPTDKTEAIIAWMQALALRLRNARVCCGDWMRVLGRSPTECIGTTAIFLDPPYGEGSNRKVDIYSVDSMQISADVREWAIAHGDNKALRIALCGYEGEHKMPKTWRCVAWQTGGGYGNNGKGNGRDNAKRERIWFSPHCLDPESQGELFTD